MPAPAQNPAQLDVEDEHAREERIGTLLERLAQASSGGLPAPPRLPSLGSDDAPGDTSELLSRVRAFLPTLAASNAELSARVAADPTSVDIENVAKGAAHVRMDLGLGVFEERRPGTEGEDDDEMESDSDSTTSDSSDSDAEEEEEDELDDSDSNSDGDSEDDDGPSLLDLLAARPTKPLPKRARPGIEVLASSTDDPPLEPEV